MKKVILILVLALLLSFALVACDNNTPETPVCDHQIVIDEAVPATCVDTGLTAGAHCSVCNAVIVPQETVDALGHTTVIDEAVAPTCADTGLTAGKHCSVCDEVLVKQETIDELDHSYTHVVTDPTATEQGFTTHTCIDCGYSYVDTYVDKLELGTWGNLTWTLNKATGELVISGTGEMNDFELSSSDAWKNYDTIIKSVTIESGITTIGNYAFFDCENLSSVTFGDNCQLTTIGDYAFNWCISLTSIVIPDSVTTIGDDAFGSCDSLTSIVIPDSVTTIGDYAFEDCYSLASIVIPDSVTIIGEHAFEDCYSLTSVAISDSVITIGDLAFNRCRSLTSITVDENNSNYKSIDGNLYSKDGTILIKYAIGKSNTTFEIPNGVTTIDCRAFFECANLTNIVIPDSVTSIGYRAFYCCNSLTDVYFTGTKERWDAIDIDRNNEDLNYATIHYNYVPDAE